MRFPGITLLVLALVFAAGCLEPGYTPLGSEVVETDIPDDAVFFRAEGVSGLGLTVTSAESEIPLFETGMLFCGYDAGTSFLAEPIFVFDPAGLDSYDGEVDQAWLSIEFPAASPEFPQDGDNPDLDRELYVKLWRLHSAPDETLPLAAPFDTMGASQIPIYDPSTGDLLADPFLLLFDGEGYTLPPDSVRAWIESGEDVTLALQWMGPTGREGVGEAGMARIFSRRSPAPDAETTTAAVLKIEDGAARRLSVTAKSDGIAASRLDPLPPGAGDMVMTTGLPRRIHLSLDPPDLPADLTDPSLIISAMLEFFPNEDLLFGMSPNDRNDDEVSGLPADEGALTLVLRATESQPLDFEDYAEGNIVKRSLAVFEEHLVYSEEGDTLLSRSRLREPLVLPLTTLFQDWINGEQSELSLSLVLDGEDERLRQLGWTLDDLDRPPRLEILYTRRPDFD